MACVYAIRHIASGRVYVGGTNNVKARWKLHRQTLRRGIHKNPRLQEAWVAFGADAFEFVILDQFADLATLRDTEQKWLDSLQAANPLVGFNFDADARSRRGRKLTAEQAERLAAFHRGRKRSPETRARISAAKRGVTVRPAPPAAHQPSLTSAPSQ